MDKAKPCVTPMSTSQALIKSDGILFHDPHLYQSVVGRLQYISFTRLDLAFAIHKVSKYMQNPIEPHWAALQTSSDADWASNRDDRSSCQCYCINFVDQVFAN
ncbi:hypothetical protein AAG906_011412 [Vitis piasezkii]